MVFRLLQLCLIILLPFIFSSSGCKKDYPSKKYITNNVIIVLIDGPRLSETWGNTVNNLIPNRKALLNKGVFCNKFYNNVYTFTLPGHTAVLTGNYENINNSGLQLPSNPSVFQYFLKTFNRPATDAWVIGSKDKLEVLSNCTNSDWNNLYRPKTDCGNNGLGTLHRADSLTYIKCIDTLKKYHPRLAIISFKEPDVSGHAGDSAKYIKGIIDTDNYFKKLYDFFTSDNFYKGNTTIIVTNDHGRHSNGIYNGFISHGDLCNGCKKIEFFAIGPDFKENYICNTAYEQIDISATIAELMGFAMPTSKGKVMKDIFKN